MAAEGTIAAPVQSTGRHKQKRRGRLWFGVAFLTALGAGLAGAQAVAAGGAVSAAPAQMEAWYTNEQADLGERTFSSTCIACHGDKLRDVFANYDDAGKFFGFISGSMPADNPGSLGTGDYIAIIAYLMREMGFPAGDTPLVSKREVLSAIKMKDLHEALGFVPTE